ncbi:MAG: glutathione S-transferase family protein [Candidatus Binatus sp.]|jgi:glutathione S-transferase|uniref:glutathione S-transferase N-terminal domain-containing protein n=1 Tax=Candidatus Binatus sp. TaxID=2811406 RepID=UPI003C774E3B
MTPLKLVGGFGSPYSRKMRAVLRFRRIPFTWIMRGSAEDVAIPDVPVALIPVLVFENNEAMIDSTFQIKRLEKMFAARSIIPRDPAIAFLDAILEDYADEWLTKPMFHYRWKYAADIHKASHVLALDRNPLMSRDTLAKMSSYIAERQIERLRVVGSNDVTTPVIEASYRRILGLLDSHLVGGNRFLMGARPGAGDFGFFGQLSQLAHFDPTPAAIAAAETPRVVSWVSHLDDLSSLEVDDTPWPSRDDAAASLRPFLVEVGRVYAPFLIANARALASRATEVRCEIDGLPWVQQPFPYQGKCLRWLREAREALSAADREYADAALKSTGADSIFSAPI